MTKKGMLPAIIPSKHLTVYREMSAAIARCYRIDECKDIIDKSVALAAYYEQIKDTETERMFYRVRLRAWRRIGEMLSGVDLSGCGTRKQEVDKIRESFSDSPVMSELSDSRIYEIRKLMTVSDKDFEFALKRITSGGIQHLIHNTPDFLAEIAASRAKTEQQLRNLEKERQNPKHRREQEERRRAEQIESRHRRDLAEASELALEEVGITLERKDRSNMKQIVFLIKEDVHAVMRQAAFDQKITMQEILRRGLKMWLIAHNYDFPKRATTRTDFNFTLQKESEQTT